MRMLACSATWKEVISVSVAGRPGMPSWSSGGVDLCCFQISVISLMLSVAVKSKSAGNTLK